MRVISVLVVLLLMPIDSQANNEFWGIYQLRKNISNKEFILIEYVRRDKESFFESKNLDLVRLSYGSKWRDWTYLIGAAYVDFENSSDEKRLHQFFVRNFRLSDLLQSTVRVGLEERSFISDNQVYLRGRLRGLLNVPLLSNLDFSFYDEMLFALNGSRRFYQGLNENRLGLGLRLKIENAEIFIYQTFAKVKTLKNETEPKWLQLQITFTF